MEPTETEVKNSRVRTGTCTKTSWPNTTARYSMSVKDFPRC